MIDTRCGLRCEGCEWKEPYNCGECVDIPCELLMQYSCDPEHGDTLPGARIEQCRKWADEKKQNGDLL